MVMEVLNIGIKIQEIIPPTIVTMIIFPTLQVLKCIWVMEDVDIGLVIPATLTISIMDFLVEVDICIKRTGTLHIAIMNQ